MDGTIFLNENMYSELMAGTVDPYLETRAEKGKFKSFDGRELYYENYRADEPERSVVIVHGFTESVVKYHELAYYFLRKGSNVYLLEQRGHGRSFRYVDDPKVTHIERFEEYVLDLEAYVDAFVTDGLPRMLYAHSMGGAVGALFMEKRPAWFDRAVLSSPMIAPERGGYPLGVSKLICGAMIAAGKGSERFFASHDSGEKERFEESEATSRQRFDYYNEIKFSTPEFSNNAPTNKWVYESLKVTSAILGRGKPESIETGILMYQSAVDNMVRSPEQDAFAARLKKCTKRKITGSRHEIYRSTDDVLRPVVEEMIRFYSGE